MVGAKKAKKISEVDPLKAPTCGKCEQSTSRDTDSADDQTWQGEIGYPRQQLPSSRKFQIEYYAMLAKTGVHHSSGNNSELGRACGKCYRVCTLATIDPGDSDVIRNTLVKSKPGKLLFIKTLPELI